MLMEPKEVVNLKRPALRASRRSVTARNLLLEERSGKPEIGGTHGDEKGLISTQKVNQAEKRAHFSNGANRREGVPMPA